MTLDDGRRLTYRDVRRLGRIYLLRPDEWERFSARIGPEPLDPGLTAEAFGAVLARSRQAIKKVIMDQRRIAGVGNIYANEALFVSGIDPSKPADRLTAADHQRLLTAVQDILRAAVAAEGTTIRDYRTASGKPGGFQTQLFVYGREGEPCRNCGTPLAATHTIDARTTVFCYHCQR
jgi:formamidopyrimidine-DNA glycosylase